jgi:shikimate dehydrogenase
VSSLEADINSVVALFESSESEVLPPMSRVRPSIAAVGSVVNKALASPLLRKQLAKKGIDPQEYLPYGNVHELLEGSGWSLALVLSPFKQAVTETCDALTESVMRTSVVDTVVRGDSGQLVGVNTNSLSAAWAVKRLSGGIRPERCLIAGTGASARSCVVGLSDLYGELEIGIVGRSPERAAQLANDFSVSVVEDIETYAPDLVINATTVGETSDQDLHFPLETVLVAGTRYFDLNNRTSALQLRALEHGCVTLSGVVMQTIVNALRVHLLARTNRS